MNKPPLVSIALATFNGEKHLDLQLRSVLEQDYRNFEVVISDDGSTDATLKIIEKYATQDRRIRFFPHSDNVGVVRNFARCFAECRGNLISPCDQDDIWYPEKTRRLVESLGDAQLIYCNSRFVDSEGNSNEHLLSDELQMIEGNDPRPFLFSDSIYGHAMIFNKSLLDGTGRITNVPHDWWIGFVAASRGKIKYLDQVLVDYRRHDSSVTQEIILNKSYLNRRKQLQDDLNRLRAMANFPGPHQSYCLQVLKIWEKWLNGIVDLRMLFEVLNNGDLIYFAFLKKKSKMRLALKYLAGQRLKNIFRPSYYPMIDTEERIQYS